MSTFSFGLRCVLDTLTRKTFHFDVIYKETSGIYYLVYCIWEICSNAPVVC